MQEAAEMPQQAQATALADLAWFELFEDAELQRLLDQALGQNLQLRVALARVLEARQAARFAGAGPLPNISGTLRSNPAPGAGQDDTTYLAGVAFAWELDVFGKLRRGIEAADAELLASESSAQAVMVSLVAEVASNYFALRELDRRIAIVERTIASQADSLALVRSLKASGVVSAAEENQALALLASSQAQLPALEAARSRTENALATLLGLPPSVRLAARDSAEAPVLPSFTPGLPSSLLEQRPDVRAAEARLQAATARLGIAIANRFPVPTIGIGGIAGVFATELESLNDGSELFSWGPSLTVPLLDFGRTASAVGIADAQLLAASEQYRLTVLTALREVADALVNLDAANTVIEHARTRAEAAGTVLRLQRLRFRQGVVAYLEVLDAERQLLAAELALAEAQFGRTQRFIALYRALGGGSDPERLRQLLQTLQDDATAAG
jgi:multidrug efflux system outer membrane protein